MTFIEELSTRDECIELFKNTIFGSYLNIPKCNYQGQITKCLLLLEVEQDNTYELHIRHANGNVLHFSIKEFAIIIGLKCTENIEDIRYPDSTTSRLVQRYFPKAKDNVSKERLIQRFTMGIWDNIQDVVKWQSLTSFIFSQLNDTHISIEDFLMIKDGRYQQFPWGQLTFSKLMKSLWQEFTSEKQMYRLSDMPYALNVWIYECAFVINEELLLKKEMIALMTISSFTTRAHSYIQTLRAYDMPDNRYISFSEVNSCLSDFINFEKASCPQGNC
ncbi:hypothetical protein H5410_007011 [Solanum commersonii]|uniref:DUF1985 domain-containing protein n=1 Tax=Solanum commersonii TaxID=4109 RepID=A0A9J6ABF7_SOLCO|nr:hypothetical protein H5410_007011 [Solanum commersonii]